MAEEKDQTADDQQAQQEASQADAAPETQADAGAMASEALDQTQESVDDLIRQAAEQTLSSDVEVGKEAATGETDIDMLGDVDLNVTIELGRTQMLVEDVLKLGRGAVVELDKLAGDPVDIYVNNCLVARGEVLVLNDNFCIRISEIVENLEEQAEEAAMAQASAE